MLGMRPTDPGDETAIETLLLDTAARGHGGWRVLRWLVALALVLLVALGAWLGAEPAAPDLRARAVAAGDAAALPAHSLVEALALNVEILLARPGGLLANDVLPPGVLMDDAPAFEAGVLRAQRTGMTLLGRLLDDLQPARDEDADLVLAATRFRFDERQWAAPAAEEQFAEGVAALRRWQAAPRALPSQRHYSGPALAGACRLLADGLDAEVRTLRVAAGDVPATGSEAPPADRAFHGARGHAWALRNILAGLALDAAPRLLPWLDGEGAPAVLALDAALAAPSLPVTLSGDAYGLLANHPRALAERLDEAVRALRRQAACLESDTCRPS
jgi:hypothetical protein